MRAIVLVFLGIPLTACTTRNHLEPDIKDHVEAVRAEMYTQMSRFMYLAIKKDDDSQRYDNNVAFYAQAHADMDSLKNDIGKNLTIT